MWPYAIILFILTILKKLVYGFAIILFILTILKKLVYGFAGEEDESQALTYPCHVIVPFPLIN